MTGRRPTRRMVLLVLGILLVAYVAYVGWSALRVNRALSASVTDAAGIQSAVRSGDEAALDRSIESMSLHAGRAAHLTGGLAWRPLTWLPIVGDDAAGVRTVSSVVDDLTDDLVPLVDAVDGLNGLVPTDGQFDVEKLVSLQQPVSQGASALNAASQRLHEEDTSGFVDRLAARFQDLTQRVDRARRGLSTADTALQVMPTMLGRDEPRNYLMVFQNNAEIRATGGIAGSVSMLDVDGGALSIGRQSAGGAAELVTDKPVLPLTPAELRIYDQPLGTFFLNGTMTPDYPRGAELMRAHWQRAFPDDQVDGVLTVDPIALSYLLAATGPVEVDGMSLASDTVVDQLLHETYVRLADPADQDEFFADAAKAVFSKLIGGDAEPRDLLSALAKGAGEHRILVHSFEESEQSVIDNTVIGGRLITDPQALPQIGVYLGDLTGSKMSYYLRTTVNVEATSCKDGIQTYSGSTVVTSTAPADVASQPAYVTGGGGLGTPAGNQVVFVRFHGPVGGTVGTVTYDDDKLAVTRVDQDGRIVVTTFASLAPGDSATLRWTMTSGVGQTGATSVSVTPGVLPGNNSTVIPSPC